MGTLSQVDVRKLLEKRLVDAVRALREVQAAGNIVLKIPETGDLVAVLRVDDEEATALASLLYRAQ